jgi:hypothetical protein
MNLNAEIGHHTRKLASMSAKEKRAYLQDLIGEPTADKAELHMQALLISRLNASQIWPHRSKRASQ